MLGEVEEEARLEGRLLMTDDTADDKPAELLIALDDLEELLTDMIVLLVLELEVEFDVVFKHLILCQLPLLSPYSY